MARGGGGGSAWISSALGPTDNRDDRDGDAVDM